jgi:hypothetical protein
MFLWPTASGYNKNDQKQCRINLVGKVICHYDFHSFPIVDWFCLFIYLWVLTFPLEDCSEFGGYYPYATGSALNTVKFSGEICILRSDNV